jgi:hypothetical protein
MDRLAAIETYLRLRTRVLADRGALGAAVAVLHAEQAGVTKAEAGWASDRHAVATTDAELAQFAVAAYTGQAYVSPEAGPDVVSAGGPDGSRLARSQQIQEADVLVGAITGHIEQEVVQAGHDLRLAADSVRVAVRQAGAAAHLVALARATLDATMRARSLARATALEVATASTSRALASSVSATAGPASPGGEGPTILGRSLLDAADLAGWYASTGMPDHTAVPIGRLAADYLAAGARTGVRADIAFAQSIVETGYFTFPAGGQLTGGDNNFAGIGACDSCAHGWRFPTAAIGVAAQLELLDAYASPRPVPTPLIGPVGVGGCCTTWMALSGTWASNEAYGLEILGVYTGMIDWAIPRELAAAGLVASAGPTGGRLAGRAGRPRTGGAPLSRAG